MCVPRDRRMGRKRQKAGGRAAAQHTHTPRKMQATSKPGGRESQRVRRRRFDFFRCTRSSRRLGRKQAGWSRSQEGRVFEDGAWDRGPPQDWYAEAGKELRSCTIKKCCP